MASIDHYLTLIPAEHQDKPNYVATITLSIAPYVDMQNKLAALNLLFDLDVAVGQQLDYVGQWIGRTRFIPTPLNIYFSWGISGLGWGEGIWWGPYEASTGILALPDYNYRILLKATVAANMWDGTIPGAYQAWNILFEKTSFGILIQDYDNMTMAVALIGGVPDPITQALFTTGELDLKPAGVELIHILPTVYPAGNVNNIQGTPLFGWGVSNNNIGGWGQGAWVKFTDIE